MVNSKHLKSLYITSENINVILYVYLYFYCTKLLHIKSLNKSICIESFNKKKWIYQFGTLYLIVIHEKKEKEKKLKRKIKIDFPIFQGG